MTRTDLEITILGLLIFFVATICLVAKVSKETKHWTFEERMQTCHFSTYSQQIECRKVKAIEAQSPKERPNL